MHGNACTRALSVLGYGVALGFLDGMIGGAVLGAVVCTATAGVYGAIIGPVYGAIAGVIIGTPLGAACGVVLAIWVLVTDAGLAEAPEYVASGFWPFTALVSGSVAIVAVAWSGAAGGEWFVVMCALAVGAAALIAGRISARHVARRYLIARGRPLHAVLTRYPTRHERRLRERAAGEPHWLLRPVERD